MTKKGKCPDCGTRVKLDESGLIMPHDYRKRLSKTATHTLPCTGFGKYPKL